jgi:hypothetical protein
VAVKIRSASSPLIMGRRDGAEMTVNCMRIGKFLNDWEFLGVGQRRGAHVSIPKIGSRGVLLCFGGIWGCHADLRRELWWGNFKLGFFGALGGSPRGCTEEGGHFVFTLCFWGNFNVNWVRFCEVLTQQK